MAGRDDSRFDWRFWLQWTLATPLGWGVGCVLGVTIAVFLWIGAVVVWGAIIGFVQWWVLESKLPGSQRWIGVTAAGWTILLGVLAVLIFGPFLIENINLHTGEIAPAALTTFFAAIGTASLFTGLVQWLFFLRRRVRRSGWWVLTNLVAFGIAFWVLIAGGESMFFGVALVVAGLVYGVLTGVTLTILLDQPQHGGLTERGWQGDSSGGQEAMQGL